MEHHYNNLKLINLFRNLRILLYIISIVLLYIIDVDFIEGRSLCIIYNLFNIKCITCGFTRALFNFSRGNFIKAINYNFLIVIILPLFIYLIIEDLFRIIYFKVESKSEKKFSLIEKLFIKFINLTRRSIH